MKAVILDGGLGARISEETHLKPKPMIEDHVTVDIVILFIITEIIKIIFLIVMNSKNSTVLYE
jgi:dTDP-glucose pyrophosphorylase